MTTNTRMDGMDRRIDALVKISEAHSQDIEALNRRIDRLASAAKESADRDAVFAQLAEMRKKLDDCRDDNGRLTDALENVSGSFPVWRLSDFIRNGVKVDPCVICKKVTPGTFRGSPLCFDCAAEAARVNRPFMGTDVIGVATTDSVVNEKGEHIVKVSLGGVKPTDPLMEPVKPVKVDADAVAWARADAEADAQRRAMVSRMHGLGHIAEGGHPETEECGAPIGSTFCCLDKGHEGNHESEDQQDERAR